MTGLNDGRSDTWSRNLLCLERELRSRVATILHLDARNYTSPAEFLERNSYFFFDEEKPSSEHDIVDSTLIKDLPRIIDHLKAIPPESWTGSFLHHEIAKLHQMLCCIFEYESADHFKNRLKTFRGRLQTLLRSAVSFGRPGPGIGQTMAILGKDVTLRRLKDTAVTLSAINHDHGIGLAPQ